MATDSQPPERSGEADIFGSLRAASKDAVLGIARDQIVAAGEMVFLQDDPGDALYYVNEGLIEISVTSIAGRKLSLNLVKPGEVFGEIAALDSGVRTSAAQAVKDSRLGRVNRRDLLALIRREPEISIELIGVLCGRLRWISSQVEDRAFLPLPVRLAKGLLMLHHRLDGEAKQVTLSQTEIASFVGATREATSKTLNQWRKNGWIEMSRGRLIILQEAALEDLADLPLP